MEYLFVIRGRLEAALRETLSPVSVLERTGSTEMRLEIEDDAELYGVLARLERLGMSIESFEPALRDAKTDPSPKTTDR